MSDTPMKKQALLIGINEYQILPGLKYARQDAEAVADALKQNYCFTDNEVMVLTDARPGLFKPTDKYIIQDHLEKLANQELDLFIFGFWGHGLFRNGQRYLCPLNVMANRAEHQGLPFDELQELLAKIRAKNTCLILDCCQTIHDRGEAETLTASDKASMENAARDIVLRRKEQMPDFQSNVAILNSCKEGQSAYEWDARQHGLFTAHLLDAMKKRSNSVMQIASYISSNIEKTALELGKEQTPFYKLEGDIVLPVETKAPPLVSQKTYSVDKNPLKDILEKEENKKREGIEQLQIEAVSNFKNKEYEKAILNLEEILSLDSNLTEAQQLLTLCKLRVEERKLEEAKNHDNDVSIPDVKAGERKTLTVNCVEFAFRWCPADTFMMGSPWEEEYRHANELQHQVTLTKGFWMMETQVTVGMFKAFVSDTGYESKGKTPYRWIGRTWELNSKYSWHNPGFSQDDKQPVTCVSWNDAVEFCKWLSKKTGQNIMLPTEAQWEYACRAGTTGAYAGNLDETAWYGGNSNKTTHLVGTKMPNAWGLYDMHGNIWEWCVDWYDNYFSENVIDPAGPSSGNNRVNRGGSWSDSTRNCRSAIRGCRTPEYRSNNLGFRCTRGQ